MTNKSIRDYINLIENAQREYVAEGSASVDFKGRLVDQELVKKQGKYWDQAAKEKKQQELKRSKQLKKQGVAEGSEEQVYKVVALDKSNALKKPTKLNVKASSIEDVFSRLAANDWYALSINGVEVVAGKRLKQGVAEEQLEETTPEALAKIDELTRK